MKINRKLIKFTKKKFLLIKSIIIFLFFIYILINFNKTYTNYNYLYNYNNCKYKTFLFQRKYFNDNYNKYLFLQSNYNLSFFHSKNINDFRFDKLAKMGLQGHNNLDIYNLYILPYDISHKLKNKITNLIINKNQKINRYFNYKEYVSKSLLYLNYRKMQKIFPSDYNYMLETYSYPEDRDLIISKFENYYYDSNSTDNIWLIKLKLSSIGHGISIMKKFPKLNKNFLITKYLNNPHIIKGVKYDLRFHGLITGIKPLKIYLYNEGLVRFATEKYDYYNQDNKYSFLTNLYVNIKNKKRFIYPQNNSNIEDSNLWNLKVFQNYLLKIGINYNTIYDKVKDIFIKMIFSVRKKLIKTIDNYKLSNSNFYHLIGFDIILDENLKPYLLEANRYTGLRDDNDAEKNFTFNLIIDTINLVGLKDIYKKDNDKEDKTDKEIEDNICELNRPRGGYNLIFPLKNNIKKYRLFYNDKVPKEDLELWKYLRE